MGTFQLRFIAQKKDHGKLLKDFLREHGVSKALLTDIKFNGGKMIVNGCEKNVRHILQAGEEVLVLFPDEKRSTSMLPEKVDFKIVYEDEHCLVVNKPPFLNTIPSREHPTGSLANGLLYYYDQKGENYTVHIVNRLDRDTSGLMLVAKHRYSHSLFAGEQRTGTVKRVYNAIVHGIVEKDQGTINAPISRKEGSIIERTVREDGQEAVTHYRVLERFSDKTLVELHLETGRTHQIRVHMAFIGHPLLGDTLYGGEKKEIDRQALHSRQLSFFHPVFKQRMEFRCKLPSDMEKILKHAH